MSAGASGRCWVWVPITELRVRMCVSITSGMATTIDEYSAFAKVSLAPYRVVVRTLIWEGNTEAVRQWLKELRLERYVEAFDCPPANTRCRNLPFPVTNH